MKSEGEWGDGEREIGKTKSSERHSSVLWANNSIDFQRMKMRKQNTHTHKKERKMSF